MAKWLQKAIQRKGRIKKALGISEGKEIPASKMGRLRALAKKKGAMGSKTHSLAAAARLALRLKEDISKKEK